MILENVPKESDDSRTLKSRNYPQRALSPCTGYSLITLDNVHVCPQWRIALARLTRPMRVRMHPTHPLDPPLDYLRFKNVEKGQQDEERARTSSARAARRQAIDSMR